jgi:hypothetical protein
MKPSHMTIIKKLYISFSIYSLNFRHLFIHHTIILYIDLVYESLNGNDIIFHVFR